MVYLALIIGLPIAAVYLLADTDTAKAIGIGMLVASAVLYAVPVTPIMRVRRRRRARRQGDAS